VKFLTKINFRYLFIIIFLSVTSLSKAEFLLDVPYEKLKQLEAESFGDSSFLTAETGHVYLVNEPFADFCLDENQALYLEKTTTISSNYSESDTYWLVKLRDDKSVDIQGLPENKGLGDPVLAKKRLIRVLSKIGLCNVEYEFGYVLGPLTLLKVNSIDLNRHDFFESVTLKGEEI